MPQQQRLQPVNWLSCWCAISDCFFFALSSDSRLNKTAEHPLHVNIVVLAAIRQCTACRSSFNVDHSQASPQRTKSRGKKENPWTKPTSVLNLHTIIPAFELLSICAQLAVLAPPFSHYVFLPYRIIGILCFPSSKNVQRVSKATMTKKQKMKETTTIKNTVVKVRHPTPAWRTHHGSSKPKRPSRHLIHPSKCDWWTPPPPSVVEAFSQRSIDQKPAVHTQTRLVCTC